jgi:hypothetical protein
MTIGYYRVSDRPWAALLCFSYYLGSRRHRHKLPRPFDRLYQQGGIEAKFRRLGGRSTAGFGGSSSCYPTAESSYNVTSSVRRGRIVLGSKQAEGSSYIYPWARSSPRRCSGYQMTLLKNQVNVISIQGSCHVTGSRIWRRSSRRRRLHSCFASRPQVNNTRDTTNSFESLRRDPTPACKRRLA